MPFILGLFIVFVVGVVSLLGGSFFVVDQGERAVVTRLGKVVAVEDAGFHTKTPFITSAHEISVRTSLARWNSLQTYSMDQQAANLQLSIGWHVNPGHVVDVYVQFGDADGLANRVLFPQAVQATKVVFGRFNAVTSIQDRGRLNTEVQKAIIEAMAEVPAAVIDSVQIENIDFSDAYESAIEQRMQAEVEVERLRQNAEREKVTAQITVTKAQAEADSTRAKASAEAEAIRLRAAAEADAIKQRGAALRDNPQLVELTKAERWNGVLPATMVPGAAVPFIDVN